MIGSEFRSVVRAAFVVVHGVAVWRLAIQRVHETAGPLAIGTAGTASHHERFRAAVFAKVHGELPVEIGINLGPHVAATTPVFIANAPVANAERLWGAVLSAFFGESAATRNVAVCDPIAQFVRCATADVACKIRLGAEQSTQCNEFVRAEAPVFDVTSPMDIHALGPLLRGTDAVTPVIVVRVAAPRPAQYRDADFLEILDCLFPIAVDVGNRCFLADPQTAVDAGTKMLGEMTVKLRA